MSADMRGTGYRAYLLRLWHEDSQWAGPPRWRFSLEDPHTGERKGFSSIEHLCDFLQQRANEAAAAAQTPPQPDESLS